MSDDTSNTETLTFRDCWLLFGGVNDVGWTHAHNVARKEIHIHMREKYRTLSLDSGKTVNVEFESITNPGSFFMSPDDRHALIVDYIENKKCDLVFASSAGILNDRDVEYAENNTHVSFVRMLDPPQRTGKPPNLVDCWTDWFPSSFVAGAVAASLDLGESNNCAGFLTAFETAGGAWAHSTGFALGWRWKHADKNAKVHVVTMNGYYRPDAEVVAATQIIEEKGCNVISKHTDPNAVDEYVYGLRNGLPNREVISISRYIDMSLFVGDTVITSQVTDFESTFLPTIESAFLSKVAAYGDPEKFKNAGAMYEYDETTSSPFLSLTDKPINTKFYELKLSPFTSFVKETEVEKVVKEAYDYLKTNNPLCDVKWRKNKDVAYAASDADGKCPPREPPKEVVSYLDLGPNVVYYDNFKDAGEDCEAGTYYRYGEDLVPECLPCPVDTFRNKDGNDGDNRVQSACIPCPAGTVAVEGSAYCKVFVEEELNQLGDIRHFGFVLAALVVVMSLGFGTYVFTHKTHRAIRASQPIFLYLLCAGTFFMGLSIIPLSIDDSVASVDECDTACVAFPWLLVLGFSSSFSALFSKIWRINKIFQAANKLRRIWVNTRDVMIPFVGMMTANVVLLLCWTLVDPPRYNRFYTNVSKTESYGTCWGNWTNTSIALVSLLLILNFSAVIFANQQAYQARFVSDEYSESKYIWLIMASFMQILLVALPLLFLVYKNPTAFFFLTSAIVFVISSSLLLLIFGPKIIFTRKKEAARAARTPSQKLVSSNSTSEGEGLVITNTATASSMKKELDEYKRKLEKSKAMLQSKGLTAESSADSARDFSQLELIEDEEKETAVKFVDA